MRVAHIVFALSVISLVGCSEREVTRYDQLKADDVLIQVNAASLTRAACENQIDMRFALMRAAGETLQGDVAMKARNAILSGIVAGFVQNELMAAAVDEYRQAHPESGFEVCLQRNRQKFLDRTFDGTTNTLEIVALVSTLPQEQQDLFDETITHEATLEAFVQTAFHDQVNLSSNVVEQGINSLNQYNLRVQATNVCVWALATNVWRKAQSGEDFVRLVDMYSQDLARESGGSLGECTQSEFSSEEGYWDRLVLLKEGEVTPPVLTSSGLEIVRVDKILTPEESHSGEKALVLSRIFFRLGMEVKDYTAVEYKREMEAHYRTEILKKVLFDQWRKARVVCPFGPRILPDMAWKQQSDFPKDSSPKEPMLEELTSKKVKEGD